MTFAARHLVASKLGDACVVAERACHSPAYLAMEVTVAGDGKVQAARLLNYPHEPTRQCIERELKAVPFPRATGVGAAADRLRRPSAPLTCEKRPIVITWIGPS